MKNAKKIIALLLCAVLLVAGSVAGTLAYLTSKTGPVNNTFSAGNVAITLDEADVNEYGKLLYKVTDAEGKEVLDTLENPTEDSVLADRVTENKYKLIPSQTYVKDPTIKVSEGSEDCWVFVKIENGLGNDATITMNSGWTKVAENSNVWMYGTALKAGETATPFNEFTFSAEADPEDYKDAAIVITGYAVQKAGLTSAAAAWESAPASWN